MFLMNLTSIHLIIEMTEILTNIRFQEPINYIAYSRI